MKKIWNITLLIGLSLVLGALFAFLIYLIIGFNSFSDEIKIVIIGLVGTSFTVISSILIAKISSMWTEKSKIDEEIRQVKQQYYNSLIDKLIRKFDNVGWEQKEEVEFCIEVARLPLYASQEVIAWFEEFKVNPYGKKDFTKLYEIIRKDIQSSKYKNFKNLTNVCIAIPNYEDGGIKTTQNMPTIKKKKQKNKETE